MEAKDLYKLMRIPSLAKTLANRSKNIIAERQEKRRECFWGARVDLNRSPAAEKKKPSRAEMLKKWKAEKVKKLEEEKKKQKPIFKVGVVHRKVTGSPIITQPKTFKKTAAAQETFNSKKPQTNEAQVEMTQIVTRAKAKNFGITVKVAEVKPATKLQKGFNNKFYKIEAGKKKQIDSHVFKVPEIVSKLPCQGLTYPYSPKLLKRKETAEKLQARKLDKRALQTRQKIKAKVSNAREHSSEDKIMEEWVEENAEETVTQEKKKVEEILKENIAEDHVKGKATEECTLVEFNSQSQMVSTPEKITKEDDFRPIVYSPFVTVRSGRKSKGKSKKSLIIDVEEQIKREESEFNCRIFSFRKYIECERKRLLETCDKWKKIYAEFEEVPVEVEGDIDSVIGKTNLLTSDKFMQFEGLIEKCDKGDPFVKIDDLQGFQDWVSIEVERIDKEFHKLEKLKRNNWKSEAAPVEVTKTQKAPPKVTKNVPRKPVASSSIRSHILAARKLLKEGNGTAGVQSPAVAFELVVKATTPKKKESLLKNVLNSETKKISSSSSKKSSPVVRERRNSGLEIMMASQKNKFPTPVKLQKSPLLTDYEIFVGTEKTPSRSILKKTPKTTNSSKGHVSFKKQTKNLAVGGRGLSEKYFQPSVDDDSSPMRVILGDLGNVTPSGMMTRSRKRQISLSGFTSPQVN